MIYALEGRTPNIDPKAFVAPSADVIGAATIGEGSSVWFSTTIRADFRAITVGRYTSVQDGAVLHADPNFPVVVGDYVTIGHRAVLHGCTIQDRVLIGMGAIVLNGAVVEEGSIIGAGAVVPEGRVIPAGSLAVGIPAKVVRELGQDEAEKQKTWAEHYSGLAARDYLGRIKS